MYNVPFERYVVNFRGGSFFLFSVYYRIKHDHHHGFAVKSYNSVGCLCDYLLHYTCESVELKKKDLITKYHWYLRIIVCWPDMYVSGQKFILCSAINITFKVARSVVIGRWSQSVLQRLSSTKYSTLLQKCKPSVKLFCSPWHCLNRFR